MNYSEFLESKAQLSGSFGFDPIWLPDRLFDFQKYITEWGLKKGRGAYYADTGLGKTIIQLVTAENIVRHTNGNVLILTPLAVAFQFVKEAKTIDMDIYHSKDGTIKSKITVTNYERLHYFDPNYFEGVILDESSILKNFDGAYKTQITEFMRKIKYRYLSTATPSPNDFIELGTSSEALGHLGYMDMLGRYFGNNENNIRPQEVACKWYLKPHAKDAFFKWVNSWSISIKKPSDLGFSDERYVLPELIKNYHSVRNENNLIIDGQMQMYNIVARTMTEVREEQKATIPQRCEKAAELTDDKDISFLWCNLNPEGKLLNDLVVNSIEVSGSDSIERKEEAIEWFLGEKCLCKSKNFGKLVPNWQKDLLCGKKNMQKLEEKSMLIQRKKEIKGKHRVEILMKIKTTCQNITMEIKKSSNLTENSKRKKIEEEESVMLTIKNIETNVSNILKGQQLQRQDLRELLNSMVLLLNSMKIYTKNKMVNVQYVGQKVLMMEKEIDFLLTTAIQQIKSEVCYVQNVTSELDNLTIIQNYLIEHQCTCGYESGNRKLISKTKIFGFGLNLQHCNHTVYFPTWSFEQMYQAIRRFWRFGQKRPVTVDIVFSDGQKRVLETLELKTKKSIELQQRLNDNLHGHIEPNIQKKTGEILLPSFI